MMMMIFQKQKFKEEEEGYWDFMGKKTTATTASSSSSWEKNRKNKRRFATTPPQLELLLLPWHAAVEKNLNKKPAFAQSEVVSNWGSVKFRKTQRGTDRHRQIGRQIWREIDFWSEGRGSWRRGEMDGVVEQAQNKKAIMNISNMMEWEESYTPLPYVFMALLLLWTVCVIVWTFNTWTKRRWQQVATRIFKTPKPLPTHFLPSISSPSSPSSPWHLFFMKSLLVLLHEIQSSSSFFFKVLN